MGFGTLFTVTDIEMTIKKCLKNSKPEDVGDAICTLYPTAVESRDVERENFFL